LVVVSLGANEASRVVMLADPLLLSLLHSDVAVLLARRVVFGRKALGTADLRPST
jgi:hypothetical protein